MIKTFLCVEALKRAVLCGFVPTRAGGAGAVRRWGSDAPPHSKSWLRAWIVYKMTNTGLSANSIIFWDLLASHRENRWATIRPQNVVCRARVLPRILQLNAVQVKYIRLWIRQCNAIFPPRQRRWWHTTGYALYSHVTLIKNGQLLPNCNVYCHALQYFLFSCCEQNSWLVRFCRMNGITKS